MSACEFLNNGVTAHRGDPARHPENTIASFAGALDLGADWIELDVRRTKDGRLVVIHDENTERIGDARLKISEVSYEELREVDAAFQFRKNGGLDISSCPRAVVPLLSDVIALIRRQGRTRASLQPKESVVGEILSLAKKMDALEWIGFNDGDVGLMTEVKNFDSRLPVFWDVGGREEDIGKIVRLAGELRFECVVMHESGVDEPRVGKLHEAGLLAGAWTVNSRETMEKFFSFGVDRLYTDFPSIGLEVRRAFLEAKCQEKRK